VRSLRIAQICSSRSWGGMEMHVAQVAELLQELGHQSIIWCAPGSELERDAASRGLSTFPFEPKSYFNARVLRQTIRQLRHEPVDILHAHYGKDLWTLAPANDLTGRRPIVFIKHIGTQKAKLDLMHRYIYSRVHTVIAISQVIADNLLATHPVKPEQIEIIHHGVEPSLFIDTGAWRENIRRQWGLTAEQLLIGTIGRLQVGKGHLEYLDMAAALTAQYPQVRFVIIGEPTRGEERSAEVIYEKIKQLHLEQVVLMPGFRKDIPAVLAAMDIFAFPSRAEAFGLVLIEAMAAGKPVVSTNCDGVLDIVEHGHNGLLFTLGQTDQFINAVKTLIDDPALRQRLAQQGRATVEQKFSRRQFSHQLVQLYEKCLPQR
jgi:glycosyltransferase involved in cell wall biosynthesis